MKEAAKFANSPEGRCRGARFRRFGNASEANSFYECGDAPCSNANVVNVAAAADPVVAFSSVSRIDMNKLKKVIEMDSIEEFRELVQLNPRYLINTSGDTAAIVQEGFRFNSLHIAARNGSSRVAEHILKCVSNTEYLVRLYGTNEIDANFRKENILISYLNTPDKGNGDTPLHLAAKWGHVEVSRIIVSYRQTIRDFKNKNNEIPLDVVCSRYNGEKKEHLAKQLRTILHSYYVALYRCSDHSLPTRWSVSPVYPPSSMGPSHSSLISSLHSPFSPISAHFVLTAIAGPFENEENARAFERRWKGQGLDRRRKDFDRGTEKVGREMACEDGVEWAELWPFHDQPIDIRSKHGLELMNNYLRKKVTGVNERTDGVVEVKEEEFDEEEYEDAQEDWNDEMANGDDTSWSEGDSLGSLYSKMQALNMNDISVLNSLEECCVEVDECVDEFVTPPSTPPPVFIDQSPSKVDSDLFEVLCCLDECDINKHPLVRRFVSSMNRLEDTKRNNLPSLTSPRYWENSPRSRINNRPLRRSLFPQSTNDDA